MGVHVREISRYLLEVLAVCPEVVPRILWYCDTPRCELVLIVEMILSDNFIIQFTVGHPNSKDQVFLDLGVDDHLVPPLASGYREL